MTDQLGFILGCMFSGAVQTLANVPGRQVLTVTEPAS